MCANFTERTHGILLHFSIFFLTGCVFSPAALFCFPQCWCIFYYYFLPHYNLDETMGVQFFLQTFSPFNVRLRSLHLHSELQWKLSFSGPFLCSFFPSIFIKFKQFFLLCFILHTQTRARYRTHMGAIALPLYWD